MEMSNYQQTGQEAEGMTPLTKKIISQREIGSESQADQAFQPSGSEIPVVLAVAPRSVFSFMVNVPSSCHVLWSINGSNQEIVPKGGSCTVKPFNYRISHLVTKQSVTYDCPVATCPTSDNVMVTVDAVLNFKINNAADFVFNIGAVRANELLTGTLEEGIRLMVRRRPVSEVKAMRGPTAGQDLKDLLQRKFANCGVNFETLKLQQIWLPPQMERDLMATTQMTRSLALLTRDHNLKVNDVNNRNQRELDQLKRTNDQLIVDKEGERHQMTENARQNLTRMSDLAKQSLASAEEQVQVMILKAQAEQDRAKVMAETRKTQELNSIREEALQIRLTADQALKEGVLDSQEELAQAERRAKEIKLDAEVESQLGEQILLQRKHELALAQRATLASLAERGHYNLVGSAADVMLKSMMEGDFNRDDFATMKI